MRAATLRTLFLTMILSLISGLVIQAQEPIHSNNELFQIPDITNTVLTGYPLADVAVQAWNIEVLSDFQTAVPDMVHFTLPNGRDYEIKQQYLELRSEEEITWFGQTDSGGSVVLTMQHDRFGALIVADDAVYQIIPSANGSLLVELGAAVPTERTPLSDLEVTITDLTDPVVVGDELTWVVNVINNGPDDAPDVTLTNTLPPSVTFVSTSQPGVCSESGGTVTCNLGTIPSGDRFFPIAITAQTLSFGTTTNTVQVTTPQADPNPVNNSAAESTTVLNAAGALERKLTASDAAGGDRFGNSVGISGDTIVVGASRDDDAGAWSGSAYVFVRSSTTWTEQQKLTASDAAAGDEFGHSVRISGDTIVIGALYDDDVGSDSGSAYVFVRNGTTWTEQQKLTASDAAADDRFGNSVGISGDTVVVGAYLDDDAGIDSGSAYVFVRSGTTWTEQQKLTASDAAADDLFGESVGISGDTIVLGAPHDDDAGSISGSTYVFVRSGTTWTEQQKLTASDAAADDLFGQSVGISGDTVVVGADRDDDAGSDSGSAYVFVRSGPTWTEQQKLTASDAAADDRFGSLVGISGDTVVVGAYLEDTAGNDSGAAYVFVRSSPTWTEQQKLTASDAAADDWFGYSVGISGDTVVVGAYSDDNAYIYELSIPALTLTAPGTPASFVSSDTLTLEWSSLNTDPGDAMILDMKRDVVPPTETVPDGVNWARFTDSAFNDGDELVTIPFGVAFGLDWRFYVRHSLSSAFDARNVTFTITDTSADLSVGLTDTPDPVLVGNDITYSVTVTNNGPNDATSVTLTNTLPTEVSFVSTNQPGICSETSGTVTCAIGSLLDGNSFPVIEIVVTTNTEATILNTVEVTGAEPDADLLNNTAQVSTQVLDGIFADGFESGNTSVWSNTVP
ncbi:MAG: DUF11 domain-containing protein [bacterium]|nr:DUF11 domain-containing protein [bacterium]